MAFKIYRVHLNPNRLGLGRQFGLIHFGAFGVFLNNLSAPILVLSMFSINQPLFLKKKKNHTTKPLKTSKPQIFIWDWDLNVGRKRLRIYP